MIVALAALNPSAADPSQTDWHGTNTRAANGTVSAGGKIGLRIEGVKMPRSRGMSNAHRYSANSVQVLVVQSDQELHMGARI